jgi:hypothetical protein
MSDLKTQLGDYFENVVERLDVEDIFEQQVDGSRVQPVQPRTPPRRFPGWVYGVAAAVAILLVGVVGLLVGNGSNVAENPTSTSTLSEDAASALGVAESFMEAWVAGDGEAVAAMFSADAPLDGQDEMRTIPALHDWYRAVGQEFHNGGCQLLTQAVLTFQRVGCTYTFENKLMRALGGEPVAERSVLYVGGGKIHRYIGTGPFYMGSGPFSETFVGTLAEWVLINHPDDFERMYLDGRSSPLLDATSIALWEQYTDEFTASPGAAIQFLSKWETEARARGDYIMQAHAICWAATDRKDAVEAELGFGRGYPETSELLPEIAAMDEAIARISEEAVAEMRALPAPDTARALLNEFYRLATQTIDIHRQTAAATLAGDAALVEILGWQRVDLTHKTDQFLMLCPVELPA